MTQEGIKELRAAVDDAGFHDPRVSGWSVGAHVHHCCLSMTGICKLLLASTPPPPRSRFSLLAWLALRSGYIPRGRAKAPGMAVPGSAVPPKELRARLDESARLLAEVRKLERGAWFRHFAFGVLDRDKAIRFMSVHNRHHLKIILDIVAARNA
jgi:hypothetical protein